MRTITVVAILLVIATLTAVAVLYAIQSIPAPYLVDGDTGVILAQGGELRGDALARTVEQALANKKEN